MTTITMKIEVTDEQISGLLCTGLEGGYSPWLEEIGFELAQGLTIGDIRRDPKDKNYWHWAQLVPLREGCKLTAKDAYDNWNALSLDRDGIVKALQLMADKYPKHFADFLSGDDDAITGDVFLQLAFLGELIYS